MFSYDFSYTELYAMVGDSTFSILQKLCCHTSLQSYTLRQGTSVVGNGIPGTSVVNNATIGTSLVGNDTIGTSVVGYGTIACDFSVR